MARFPKLQIFSRNILHILYDPVHQHDSWKIVWSLDHKLVRRLMIICTEQTSMYTSTFPNTYNFWTGVYSLMSRTDIILRWFSDEESYWVEKLYADKFSIPYTWLMRMKTLVSLSFWISWNMTSRASLDILKHFLRYRWEQFAGKRKIQILSFESGCVRLQGGHLHEFLNNYSNDIIFFGIFWVPEVGNTADTPNPLDTQPG